MEVLPGVFPPLDRKHGASATAAKITRNVRRHPEGHDHLAILRPKLSNLPRCAGAGNQEARPVVSVGTGWGQKDGILGGEAQASRWGRVGASIHQVRKPRAIQPKPLVQITVNQRQ